MKKSCFSLVAVLLLLAASAQDSTAHLTEKEWKALEGYFGHTLNPNLHVQFIPSGNILLAKTLWNNGEVHLVPQSPMNFTSREMEDGKPISLSFHRDSTGEINLLDVSGLGKWRREKNFKPDPTTEIPHTRKC